MAVITVEFTKENERFMVDHSGITNIIIGYKITGANHIKPAIYARRVYKCVDITVFPVDYGDRRVTSCGLLGKIRTLQV